MDRMKPPGPTQPVPPAQDKAEDEVPEAPPAVRPQTAGGNRLQGRSLKDRMSAKTNKGEGPSIKPSSESSEETDAASVIPDNDEE